MVSISAILRSVGCRRVESWHPPVVADKDRPIKRRGVWALCWADSIQSCSKASSPRHATRGCWATEGFYLLREMDGLPKRPSTSELVDWVQALAVAGVDPDKIIDELPIMGVVLKKQADLGIARRHMSIRARRTAMQEDRG